MGGISVQLIRQFGTIRMNVLLIEVLLKVSALVLFSTGALSQDFVEEETRLRRDLSANYSVRVRPQLQTQLSIIFGLTAINYMGLRRQELSVAGYFHLIWTDDRLKWSASKYSGIKVIVLSDDQLWTPTGIVLYNSVSSITTLSTHSIPARVNTSGVVVWSHYDTFVVSCTVDITYYPFDVQVCSLNVSTFGYTMREVELKMLGPGVHLDIQGNGEWTVVSSWAESGTDTDGFNQFSVLLFSFKLRRKPLFYELNYLLPVSLIACLANLVFLLPAESGEKVNFALNVLLTFIMLLTLLANHVPTSADHISLLQVFMAVVLILCCLATVFTIFVLKVYYRNECTPPTGWLLALAVYHHNIKISMASRFRRVKDSPSLENNNNEDRLDSTKQKTVERESKRKLPESEKNIDTDSESPLPCLESEKMDTSLHFQLDTKPHLRRNEMNNVVINNTTKLSVFSDLGLYDRVSWTQVSKALDALFFYVNLLTLIITITVFVIWFHWQDLIDM